MAQEQNSPLDVLRQVYGFHEFRPHQEGIVRSILDRRDAFVVMPTGGGKSLCYQLPAHILSGTCVVVSPLISLMKDQVDGARENGLKAAFLNSTQSPEERGDVVRCLVAAELDLLYVSPERFAMSSFVESLRQATLSFVAIDEAHCISEWGHDFRPDYLNLSNIVSTFPDVPICAFTATATHRVQSDIIQKLGLRDPLTVRASFDRPNLFYRVSPKSAVEQQILDFVRSQPGASGIVYRMTRRSVEETAAVLCSNGIRALPYHAGLEDRTRAENQEAFNKDEVDVVVATIAFGMGIDKSNVRFVVHGDIPKNIESYYQETGRCGRDGESATCLLFFGRADMPRIRYFIDQIPDDAERSHALQCLRDMAGFAGNNACRRKQILAYFGETYQKDSCGACDVCAGEVERVDATRDAQILLSAISRSWERFGATHVVDIVTGANTQRIRQHGHDQIKTYGIGKDRPKSYWRFLLDNLIAQDIVVQADEKFPVLKLTAAAQDVLFKGRQIHILRQIESETPKKPSREIYSGDPGLFEALRTLRKRLADEKGVPPFVVFSDRTLREMAHFFPTDDAEMSIITGVGAQKLEQFGREFSRSIRDYLDAHPALEKPQRNPAIPQGPQPALRDRKSTTETTWELLQKGLSVKDVANLRSLSQGTICAHIEQLMLAGENVNIDQFIDPARRREITDLFVRTGDEKLGPIVEASNNTVTYEEARLVRAHLQRGLSSESDGSTAEDAGCAEERR
jgi:ATP-dependent DNA helicase RecQ